MAERQPDRHVPERHDPDRPAYEHAWEDNLEPRHLINRCDAIVRVGAAMLGAGTGSRRVAETMRQVARALDIDEIQSRVSLTEIVLTVHRRGITRTQTAEIPNPGVNADQIAALQQFARHLPEHVTVQQVTDGLDRILRRPKQWPAWAAPLGAGVACAAFAFLNNGGWAEMAAVSLAAAAGQSLRRALHRRHLNQIAMTFLAAVLATLVFLGALALVGAVVPLDPTRRAAGFMSSILFLVPGFPLMTAALDLARLDLAAGITRLTYAALLTFAGGFGLWVVAERVGIDAAVAQPLALAPPLLLGLQMLASFSGVFGFAVLFNSPPIVALAGGSIALIANPLRLVLTDAGLPPQHAAAAGTLLVGVLAWLAGRAFALPRIILSVPSVVIMIPGAAAFRCLLDVNDGRLVAGLEIGLSAGMTVLGMVVGLVAARMLTDPQWAFTAPNPPSYAAVVRRLSPYAGRLSRRRTPPGH